MRIVTETVKIDPTKRMSAELAVMGDRVSRLWNSANYLCRQSFLKKEGVPTGARLEAVIKATPEYRQLPSDVAQETLKKLSEAWKSFFALRQKWSAAPSSMGKPGFPAYRKNKKAGTRPTDYIPVKHPRSYSIDSKDVHIVLPSDRRRVYGGNGRLHVPYRGRRRHSGKMGRCELKYDTTRRRWHMAWTVEIEEAKPVGGDKVAAIDLGVRIMASLSIEGRAQALHFDGREVMKDWDWFGREIAREQSHIAGTRGVQPETRSPSSRNISLLHQKRRLRVQHAWRCMAKDIAQTCFDAGVGTVYLGWPKDILRDVVYGQSVWAGRIHGYWSFDQELKVLEAALQTVGIKAVRVGERGSSSTCPCCGSKEVVRHPRWVLRCKKCGERLHSDQAGSRNIAKFQKPSICWAGAEAAPLTATGRWTRHSWDDRSTNPGRRASGLPEFLEAA